MNLINIAIAQANDRIGSFRGEQIYEVAGNMGWLLVFIKGVFWAIVIFEVIMAAIYLNQLTLTKKRKVFMCPRCGYSYGEKEWAKKCELWCTKHKTCNLAINEHRIVML